MVVDKLFLHIGEKMNFGKMVGTVVLLMASSSVLSYESGVWTKVTQIYSKNDGSIFVYFGEDALPGCYANKGAFLTGSNIDRLYSTLLAAYLSGKDIKPLYNFRTVTEGYSGWALCDIEAVYVN